MVERESLKFMVGGSIPSPSSILNKLRGYMTYTDFLQWRNTQENFLFAVVERIATHINYLDVNVLWHFCTENELFLEYGEEYSSIKHSLVLPVSILTMNEDEVKSVVTQSRNNLFSAEFIGL